MSIDMRDFPKLPRATFTGNIFGPAPWEEAGISPERFGLLIEGHCPACRRELRREGDEGICDTCALAWKTWDPGEYVGWTGSGNASCRPI